MKQAIIGGLIAIVACCTFVASCNMGNQSANQGLGVVRFETTGADAARPAFEKGLLLLHSFEYDDAADAFQEATRVDPGFAMAYWGWAMTCNRPIWQEQDLEQGRVILDKLAPTETARIALAKTEIEKDFLKGVQILFGDGNKAVRDSSYASYMKGLNEKYPGNNEVAAFYSLSLIGWAVTGRQLSLSPEAARIAQEVIKRNPQHPGALHYLIHAYDHPEYASLALETANKYAGVAPRAAHALHMPTHTYVALGMWDEVVSSNIVSWAASVARKNEKKLGNDALGYHSYHWLEYGYLQKGEKKQARLMLDSMRYFANIQPSVKARSHLVLMQATYLAETNDYIPETIANDLNLADLNIGLRAMQYFVRGMYAYIQKDTGGLKAIIGKMTSERLVDADRIGPGGLRICGNISRSLPTQTNLLESETMEAELKAMLAALNGNDQEAEHWLKRATQVQQVAGYSYGPPGIVKPAFEMYGEWLLEKGRYGEAISQFETSLKYAPNRTLSVNGKLEAGKRSKDGKLALR